MRCPHVFCAACAGASLAPGADNTLLRCRLCGDRGGNSVAIFIQHGQIHGIYRPTLCA